MSDIDESGDVSSFPAPTTGRPRLIKFLRQAINNPEHDELYQEVLNLGYTEWQRPEHDQWGFGDMVDWVSTTFGEEAALIVMLGKFNQQVENGGIIQWLDNGYAGTEQRRGYRGLSPSMNIDLLERMLSDLEGSAIQRLPHGQNVTRLLHNIEMSIEDSDGECYTCHNHRYVKCEDCGGTGKMAVGEDEDNETEFSEEDCDVCDGEGEVPCDDCNREGQLEVDATEGDIETSSFEYWEREYYKYSSDWSAEIEGYLKSLVRSPEGGGLLSRAQAFKATESLLKMLNRLLESFEDDEDEDFDPESDLQSDIDRTNAHKRGEILDDELDPQGDVSAFAEPLIPPEVLADEFEDKLHASDLGGAYQVAKYLANLYSIDIYEVVNAVAEFGDEQDAEDIIEAME